MRRLGEYILRGRMQAIGFTSLFTVCSMIIPLMSYLFSGIVPALVTLRKGPVAGLQVVAGSLLLIVAVALFARINPYLMIMFALGIWLPTWFCAMVLRITEEQGRMLLAAGLCGLLYIALSHLLLDDVVQWWTSVLALWVEQFMPPESAGKFADRLASAAPMMNAMTTAGLVVSLVTTLFCARWWQAYLFQPGGFGQEFRTLGLPKFLTIAVLACAGLLAAGQAEQGTAALEVLVLLIFLYVFQGIAAVHRLVAAGRLARPWLLAMYVTLVVLPQAILFVACMGMVDSWMFRTGASGPKDKA
ncbi:MAG: DUF2232 domain-containing protein [Gammaproteobacteria bacterium]